MNINLRFIPLIKVNFMINQYKLPGSDVGKTSIECEDQKPPVVPVKKEPPLYPPGELTGQY